MFDIRLGTEGDFGAIAQLIQEAADWLRLKGSDQWDKPWPSQKKKDERVRRSLRAGRTWLVLEDGVIVATITCHPDANKWLWKRRERAERAVYISRLIVSRQAKGRRIGEELIDWAGKWALVQYRACWIRIDVWTTNYALQHYYQAVGFEFQRICKPWRYVIKKYPSGALLQKSTAGLELADTPRLRAEPALHLPKDAGPRENDQRHPVGSRLPAFYTSAAAMLAIGVMGSLLPGRRSRRSQIRVQSGPASADADGLTFEVAHSGDQRAD
jgi:ribosomal protein S18 acetylase RimI-like enzyme